VPLLLSQQVCVGVQVRNSVAGPRIRHPPVCSGHWPLRQRLPGHRRAASHVELGRCGVVGILVADHPVRPVEEEPSVLTGHAKHVSQGEQRQIGGNVPGEVTLAAGPGEDPIADCPDVPPDAVLEQSDRTARE